MLSPDISFPEIDSTSISPSKTYKLDFETGEIGRSGLDGKDAIEQFIRKTIVTPRFRHLIYTDNYGCEIDDLMGQGFTADFTKSEIARMVTEALIYDDRISRIYNFDIQASGDEVYVSFTAATVEGLIQIRQVV